MKLTTKHDFCSFIWSFMIQQQQKKYRFICITHKMWFMCVAHFEICVNNSIITIYCLPPTKIWREIRKKKNYSNMNWTTRFRCKWIEINRMDIIIVSVCSFIFSWPFWKKIWLNLMTQAVKSSDWSQLIDSRKERILFSTISNARKFDIFFRIDFIPPEKYKP